MFGGGKTRKYNKKHHKKHHKKVPEVDVLVKSAYGLPDRFEKLAMGRKLTRQVNTPVKAFFNYPRKLVNMSYGGKKLKGVNSKTRKGHKDFITHKGSKHFNRHGHYQKKSVSYKRGRPARPYARYY